MKPVALSRSAVPRVVEARAINAEFAFGVVPQWVPGAQVERMLSALHTEHARRRPAESRTPESTLAATMIGRVWESRDGRRRSFKSLPGKLRGDRNGSRKRSWPLGVLLWLSTHRSWPHGTASGPAIFSLSSHSAR